MNSEGLNFLGRIAEALERQVEQTNEATARQDRWRDENLRFREDDNATRADQREEELKEVREINLACLAELREAIGKIDRFAVRLLALEAATLAGAVDPVGEKVTGGPRA